MSIGRTTTRNRLTPTLPCRLSARTGELLRRLSSESHRTAQQRSASHENRHREIYHYVARDSWLVGDAAQRVLREGERKNFGGELEWTSHGRSIHQ